MTFATEKVRAGREPINVLEVDLDFCDLRYGRFNSPTAEQVKNGGFDTDLTDWSDLSTGDSSISQTAGTLRLAAGTSGEAIAEQKATLAVANRPIAMSFVLAAGTPVKVRIGTTSGGVDVVAAVSLLVGTILQFTPTTRTIFIQYRNDAASTNVDIDDVSIVSTTARGADRIANGSFPTDISGWTDVSDPLGSIGHQTGLGGYLRMNAQGAGGIESIAQQKPTTLPIGLLHEIRCRRVEPGGHINPSIRIGSTQDADDILAETALDDATDINRFTFTPTVSPIFVQFFHSSNTFHSNVDDVSIHQLGVCQAAEIDAGTAQSGSTTNIRLAATAPSFDITGAYARITSGAGVGQESKGTAYNVSTKDFTTTWAVAPSSTSVYEIHDADGVLLADRQCENTRNTTQDPTNYAPAPKTYRFCEARANLPADQALIPALQKVNTSPTKIDPTHSIGKRARVDAQLLDFPYHDIGIDLYIANRSFTAIDRGTFFGKLFARNPFYQNRPVRLRSGYITEPWSFDNFETREYQLDKVAGPDKRGIVKLLAKDALKLADDKRALMPRPSGGSLNANITDVATSFVLVPAGIGDAEYPAATFRVRIEEELIDVGSRTADTCSSLTREVGGTTKASHDAEAVVQKCDVLVDENIVDFVFRALTGKDAETGVPFAGIDPSRIPLTDWNIERDEELSSYNLSRTLSKPEGVSSILKDLAKSIPFLIFWDERAQEITLLALRTIAQVSTLPLLTDAKNIKLDSLSVSDEERNRISQVWVYYDPRNQLEIKDPKDFRRLKIRVDPSAELPEQYGEVRVLTLFIPWFDSTNNAEVIQTSSRQLTKWRDNVRRVTFKLDAKDSIHWTGDVLRIQSRQLQDVTGADDELVVRILSAHEDRDGSYSYVGEEEGLAATRVFVIGPNTLVDFAAESSENKDKYGFISNDAGLMSDGSGAYVIG